MINYISNSDGQILLFIQQHMRCFALIPVFKFLTGIGNNGFVWLIIIFGLLCFNKSRRIGLVCLLSLVICFIVNNEILKNLIERPRPFDSLVNLKVLIARPTDFSFPSGHTANSFAAAGALYYYGNKKWGSMALVLAGLIGFSRLYLGVHYPSDVLCGALLGLLISYIISKTALYLQKQSKIKTAIS